jgi:hypothetical protein
MCTCSKSVHVLLSALCHHPSSQCAGRQVCTCKLATRAAQRMLLPHINPMVSGLCSFACLCRMKVVEQLCTRVHHVCLGRVLCVAAQCVRLGLHKCRMYA